MKYLFNEYGWYAGAVAGSDLPRATAVEPPEHGNAPVIGQPWPNWSGVEWVMANYRAAPTPDPKIAQRASILAQLAAIDVLTDKPRTRREVALGNLTYLQSLDDQAAALREQLAAL